MFNCTNDNARKQPFISVQKTLKLMSYNLQVGIESRSYRDYVMQSWRHILPDGQRQTNLNKAADWLSEYDIVTLQEVDAGSVRTQFINQVAYLAKKGGFPHWHYQQNRKLGKWAAHSNGLLAKLPVDHVVYHKLPGRIGGRGALQVSFGDGNNQLLVLSVHLSLSTNARRQQLAYLSELLKGYRYFILMGDMNCEQLDAQKEFAKYGLRVKADLDFQPTFPRWKPKHQYDQIWVSQNLEIVKSEVVDLGVSDHLPIAMEVKMPEALSQVKRVSAEYIN